MRARPAVLFATIAALLLGTLPAAAGLNPEPGFSSGNVEWLGTNPLHTGTAGGRLHDGYFYVTDPRGVYIYDVSEPAAPDLVGFVNVIQTGITTSQEDPDTNGRILIVDAVNPSAPTTSARLLVIDVADKRNPKVIGSLAGATAHTWTCVLDCTYAYGRDNGRIVDLRNPTNPVLLPVDWRGGLQPGPTYTHDFTEVRPGFLMSSGQPSFYLDVRDPFEQVQLNAIRTRFHTFGFHGAIWPNEGRDRFLLMGTEIAPQGAAPAGSRCDGEHGLYVYDASAVVAADRAQEELPDAPRPPAEFEQRGSWNVSASGVYVDGNAPGHMTYCEHWFDAHPAFDGGGLVAIGTYLNGTRFLEVDDEGEITEIGWFQPVGGRTSGAYWITDEIVYVQDYYRGMEILRFTGS